MPFTKTQILEQIKTDFPKKLQSLYSVTPEEASDKQVYHVLSSINFINSSVLI